MGSKFITFLKSPLIPTNKQDSYSDNFILFRVEAIVTIVSFSLTKLWVLHRI